MGHLLLDNGGEWWHSNVLFGGVFVVVFIFVIGLAYYVMRGDRLNRLGMDDDTSHGDQAEESTTSH